MLKSPACRSVPLLVLLFTFAADCTAQEGDASPTPERMQRITAARLAIDRMIELENKYDAACADIYLDDAEIVYVRKYPNGKMREFKLTGASIKNLTRTSMPAAMTRGDISEYSELESTATKDGVRIKAKRFAKIKNATTPIEWLLVPDDAGNWRIKKERAESYVLPQSGK